MRITVASLAVSTGSGKIDARSAVAPLSAYEDAEYSDGTHSSDENTPNQKKRRLHVRMLAS